jgi:hypothetical protein
MPGAAQSEGVLHNMKIGASENDAAKFAEKSWYEPVMSFRQILDLEADCRSRADSGDAEAGIADKAAPDIYVIVFTETDRSGRGWR